MRTAALFKNYNHNHQPAALAALASIIDACRDGEHGYGQAAHDVNDPWLKGLFSEYANQRGGFASVLEKHFEQLGGAPEPRPTIAGRIHRKWLHVRSAIDKGGAVTLISECERGEHAALTRYEHALSIPMPEYLRPILLDQVSEIRRAHDQLDRMRVR
jgi:uncharacterized protein (TIGR02284 family)